MWRQDSHQSFEKVFLAYSYPQGCPVAVRWSLGSVIGKTGQDVFEVYNFKTLVAELLRCESYIVVIHANLLDLNDLSNSDRAILLHLARLKTKCQFRVFDPDNLWALGDGCPGNLIIWKHKSTKDIEPLVLSSLKVWH